MKHDHHPGYYVNLTPRVVKDIREGLSKKALHKKYPPQLVRIIHEELAKPKRKSGRKRKIKDFHFLGEEQLRKQVRHRLGSRPPKAAPEPKHHHRIDLIPLIAITLILLVGALVFSEVVQEDRITAYAVKCDSPSCTIPTEQENTSTVDAIIIGSYTQKEGDTA